MNHIYILLKSLPENSVGDLFSYNDRTGYYEHGGTKFLPRVVERNSEWFAPFYKQEDRIYTEEDMRVCFKFANQLPRNLDLSHSFEFYFKQCMEIIIKKGRI